MTPRQRKALGQQLRRIGDEMGLRDWTFNVHYEPCEDNLAAKVDCVYGQRVANLWFSHGWWEMDAAERHHTIIHELIHVVTDPFRTYLEETLPDLVGRPTWLAIHQSVRQYEEHAVDQLASALAPHMPVMEDPR